jgi:hypothetical protein
MTENSEGHSLTFEIEVGNFIEKFSVSGMFYSAASVICGGNFRHFLPQCTHAHKSLLRIDGNILYILYTVLYVHVHVFYVFLLRTAGYRGVSC